MNILGIYDGHNANVAITSGGQIVAAVEEERFSRHERSPFRPSREHSLSTARRHPEHQPHYP